MKQDDIAFKLLLSTLNNYKTRIEKLEKDNNDLGSSIQSLTGSVGILSHIVEMQGVEIRILMKIIK